MLLPTAIDDWGACDCDGDASIEATEELVEFSSCKAVETILAIAADAVEKALWSATDVCDGAMVLTLAEDESW